MTYIIAEIGINHNGDMDIAKELIDTAVKTGCDAVKFQKRTIENVYTKEELDKDRDSPWGTTNREQKEGLEFSYEQYKELEIYIKNAGIDFIISCWDLNSVKLVERYLNVDYHKVASALLTDKDFLMELDNTGKPIIVSTGMSTQEEVDKSMLYLNNVTHILACTSTYPSKDIEINLKYIDTLKEKYPTLKVGFSNHYSGALACYGAVAKGAECIEFHITKDRTMYGSDQSASIEPAGLRQLVGAVRKIENAMGDGVIRVLEEEIPIAENLRQHLDWQA